MAARCELSCVSDNRTPVAAWWARADWFRAFLGTVAFVAVGVGVIWFVKDHLGIKGDAVLIGL